MDGIALYGRDGDFAAITSAPPGFVLIAGDSGIGKSSFLSSLTAWPGEPLISSPIVLKSVSGALQTALADAISDCMTQYLSDAPDAHTAWTVLKAVGERATSISGREIGQAVVAGALAYAESKFGKEVVDIGRKVLGDVAKGGMLGFDDKLASIRVPDRVEELCHIAEDLSQAVSRPLVLRLDNAERLAPSDRGQLTELIDAVRGQVWIVACVTAHHSVGDEIIQQIATRGTTPHELPALSRPSIEEWLSSANVPQPHWDPIVRLSSGYPFFVADAVRVSNTTGSLNGVASPSGFEALLRASWTGIPEGLREIAAKLAPFADPPSDDFLLGYLGLDVLQWKILTDALLESGIFVRRSDGAAWFHDRRRAFIWEEVLTEKEREYVAGAAFAALASWLEGRREIDLWVPQAAAALARAAELASGASRAHQFRGLSDDGIAVLWGLIEVLEPGSQWSPYAELSEVIRHAEARAGRSVEALTTVTGLQADGLVEVLETNDVRLLRSKVLENTAYAALLGEIQLRFHITPRPSFASRVFDAFVRPLLGPFDAAVVTLGGSTLVDHKEHERMLRDPAAMGSADRPPILGSTVSIDGQQVSFTAKLSTQEARVAAEQAMLGITDLTPRIQLDRVLPLPQPRLRYAHYRLGVQALGVKLSDTKNPNADELLSFLDSRARYSKAIGMISSADEVEVLEIGRRRYLVDTRTHPGSWTELEVRTNVTRPTIEVSDIAPKPHDALLELQLRANGYLSGAERIVRTVTHFGPDSSITHPLTAVLADVEEAGKKYNSGLRFVLFPPDPVTLERAIRAERQRVYDVASALRSADGLAGELRRPSLLVAFWDDSESGWVSDFGTWGACALEVDDDQGVVAVRRVSAKPLDKSTWPDMRVPKEFEDHAGAPASSWHDGDASSIIATLLGYADHDARMADLDKPIGRFLRESYDIVGETV